MLEGCPPWLVFAGGVAVGAAPRSALLRLRELARSREIGR